MTEAEYLDKAQRIADEQGWNDTTIIFLLLEFIRHTIGDSYGESLTEYFQSKADEENECTRSST